MRTTRRNGDDHQQQSRLLCALFESITPRERTRVKQLQVRAQSVCLCLSLLHELVLFENDYTRDRYSVIPPALDVCVSARLYTSSIRLLTLYLHLRKNLLILMNPFKIIHININVYIKCTLYFEYYLYLCITVKYTISEASSIRIYLKVDNVKDIQPNSRTPNPNECFANVQVQCLKHLQCSTVKIISTDRTQRKTSVLLRLREQQL